jgi:ankyrin repeat protein
MGFFSRLLQKITGGDCDDEVPSAEDQDLAHLYEDCSRGHLPVITDPPVILKQGETAHFVSPVSVLEQKTETTTYRGYAGMRLKLGSVPFYLGGSAPTKVSKEVLAPIGEGHIIITNKRVILTGTKINYSTSLDKITHCTIYTDSIQILWEGRYGGRFYKMDDPRPAALVLMTLISGVPSPESVGLDSSIFPVDPEDFVYAASQGQIDIVVEFLDKGMEPDITEDDRGNTALIVAAGNGHPDVVSLLLDRGADPEIKNHAGLTALMFAAFEGYSDLVRLLLAGGAKIDARDPNGATPLMVAAASGHHEVVEILLQNGADVNAKTTEGATAVTLASEGGSQEVIKILIAAGARDAPDDSDVSQYTDDLILAAADGRIDIITRLLDNGTDGDLMTQDGNTALIAAAIRGQVEVLQLLLQRGATINKKNKDGLTALMMAASEGKADAVRFLAERGGKINIKTEDGATPLMFAALNGHSEVVEILLQGGANLNAKTKDGSTSLGAAEYGGHPEVAELLRAYGAKS